MTQQQILTEKDKAETKAFKLVRALLYKTFKKYNDIAVYDGATVAEARLTELSRNDFEMVFIEIYNKVGLRFYTLQADSLEKQKKLPNVGFFSEIWRQIVINATKDVRIASLITMVTNTTKNHIRSILVSAAANRLAPRQIAKRFTEALPTFVNSRALTIARTETGYAAALGIEQAAKQTSLQVYAVWYHATHGNSRDNHLALHLKFAKKGETFDLGDGVKVLYPHDYAGGAKENINCRCTHSYVTEDVLKEMGLVNS